jgi:hypothetical protein
VRSSSLGTVKTLNAPYPWSFSGFLDGVLVDDGDGEQAPVLAAGLLGEALAEAGLLGLDVGVGGELG